MPTVCTVSEYAFFIGKAVPNIITDAAILALALPCEYSYNFMLSLDHGKIFADQNHCDSYFPPTTNQFPKNRLGGHFHAWWLVSIA